MKKKCLIKRVSILLIVVLLLPSVGVLAANTTSQKAETEGCMMPSIEDTWYVPGDFDTIQGAIDSDLVKDGDTIYVRSGTYYEDIEVDKSIKLIGENRDTTIIDANGEDYAVSIDTSYVVIRGFTIRGGTRAGIDAYDYYLEPPFTNENTITDNIITNNEDGINLWRSSGNTITGNIITGNRVIGISLDESNDNTIGGDTDDLKNIIENNGWMGIRIYESSGNDILGNTITNSYNGIYLSFSSGNDISGNTIENNVDGIEISDSSGNDILGNTITNNEVGISLYGSGSSGNTIGGDTDDLKNIISGSRYYGIFIMNSEGYTRRDLRENNIFSSNRWGNIGGIPLSKSRYLPLDRLLPQMLVRLLHRPIFRLLKLL